MIAHVATPTLRSDIEIKNAVALALEREWTPPEELDTSNERLALREICVPCQPDDLAGASGRLPTEDPAGLPTNHILLDVIVFCPIALPGWQARAGIVLMRQVQQWRDQLRRIQETLKHQPTATPGTWNGTMYSAPFGWFLSRPENSTRWVSELQHVKIRRDKVFANCAEAGISGMEESPICYYTRPYILWPVEPGSRTHVSLVNDRLLSIERPPLTDPLLEQSDDQSASASA